MPGSTRKAKSSRTTESAPGKRIGRWLAVGVMLVAMAGAGLGYLVHQRLVTPLGSKSVTVVIAPGTQLKVLAGQLERSLPGMDANLFVLWARWRGLDRQLRAGEFELELPATIPEMVEQLIRARPVQHRLTLVEGWTWADVRQALKSAEALRWTEIPADPERAAHELGLRYPHAEGQFLPETYYFTRGDTDRKVLRRAHEALLRVLDDAWANRDPGLPLKSPYEVLILASIVEKETGWAPERPRIAGVFLSRMRRGMRLQTDPTVIYGLGAAFDGNLTRQHLADKTNPYNTYRHNGLPPTPIALPGRDAIHAVVHPEEDGSLYFVSTGEGRHTFSRSLREHNQAVRAYIRKQREKSAQ